MNHSLKFPTSCFLHNSRLCSVLAMGIDGHQTPSPLPTSSTDPLRAVLPSQLTSFGQTLATLRSATSLLLPCARTAPRSPSRSLSPSRSPHHPHHHYSIGLRAALGQPCRALHRTAAPTELNKETHDLPPGRVDRRDGCQLRTPSLNPAPRGTARHGTGAAEPCGNRRHSPHPRPRAQRGRPAAHLRTAAHRWPRAAVAAPGKSRPGPASPGFQARPARRDTGTRGGAGGSRPMGACAAAVCFVTARARLVTVCVLLCVFFNILYIKILFELHRPVGSRPIVSWSESTT